MNTTYEKLYEVLPGKMTNKKIPCVKIETKDPESKNVIKSNNFILKSINRAKNIEKVTF